MRNAFACAVRITLLATALGACTSSEPPKTTGAAGTGAAGTGAAGTGGPAGTNGGAAGTGAAGTGAAGMGAAGTGAAGTGAAGTGGPAGTGGGGAGTGAAGTGAAGAGAAGTGAPDGGASDGSADVAVARFSFFGTSQAALRTLSGNQNGFGGDLRFGQTSGLAGADEICRRIADTSMPGNGKTWRAFLSVTKGPEGTPVNAIDRIGNGPWYDRRGRLFAMNKTAALNTRPMGADPLIINDLPNEDGVPNHNPGTGIIDNHNFLTGSDTMGRIIGTNLSNTCQDWTSSAANGGKPRCGVTWPRVQFVNWIYALDEGGCAPGATPMGAEQGPPGTVGALGGYGGFYCFALTP